MQRKTRVAVANTLLVSASVIGGIIITNQLDADVGGLFPATPASNSPQGNKDMTVTGDAVDYQYGTIQLEVVRTSGKISAINLVQAGATGGREAAFDPLVTAALQAQGNSFGNLSGATFTTVAFKQALDSAISKLN